MDLQINNGRFLNPHHDETRRNFKDFLLWKGGYYNDEELDKERPSSFKYPLGNRSFDTSLPSVMWINHCTFLISLDDINILTDPIWSKRASPVRFLGPKRQHSPPLDLQQLPKIDYVLISHDHYDHLDLKTVRALYQLYPNITWIVPVGVKAWFHRQGINDVVELSWWEQIVFRDKYTFTFVPAQHFSGRSAHSLNKTLWGGWVFEASNRRFYFTGDTGYNYHDFKKIGEKWPYMDLSLIPIGSYKPRRFMSAVHVDPAEAVRIHKEVNSHFSIGMHWKTFCLSDEALDQPPYDLYLACQHEDVDPTSFVAIDPGHAFNW